MDTAGMRTAYNHVAKPNRFALFRLPRALANPPQPRCHRGVSTGACLFVMLLATFFVTGCQTASRTLPYPADFSATCTLVNGPSPERNLQFIVESDRWLRVAVGPDAPWSDRQPPRSLRLTDQQMTQLHGWLNQLPLDSDERVTEMGSETTTETAIADEANPAGVTAKALVHQNGQSKVVVGGGDTAQALADWCWDALGLSKPGR